MFTNSSRVHDLGHHLAMMIFPPVLGLAFCQIRQDAPGPRQRHPGGVPSAGHRLPTGGGDAFDLGRLPGVSSLGKHMVVFHVVKLFNWAKNLELSQFWECKEMMMFHGISWGFRNQTWWFHGERSVAFISARSGPLVVGLPSCNLNNKTMGKSL